jgi:site-specific DNA-methyltransferase (adenine-specific)
MRGALTIGATAVIAAPAGTLGLVEGVLVGDNLPLLRALPDGCAQMVYADPPFNTGHTQTRRSLATVGAVDGDRTGFGGRRYTKLLAESSYRDAFEDYLGFLAPRLEELRRVLDPTGTLYRTSTTARRTT